MRNESQGQHEGVSNSIDEGFGAQRGLRLLEANFKEFLTLLMKVWLRHET